MPILAVSWNNYIKVWNLESPPGRSSDLGTHLGHKIGNLFRRNVLFGAWLTWFSRNFRFLWAHWRENPVSRVLLILRPPRRIPIAKHPIQGLNMMVKWKFIIVDWVNQENDIIMNYPSNSHSFHP
jgi:hypothetical protein